MAPVWYVDSRGESTMAKSERQKLKLLILRDYLRSHTDEQHPVSMQQILAALEGEGIRAERKSVYDDLDTLRDYGMEIRKVSGKNGGYYVPERDFALSELKLLVDAVQAARFLSEKESMALIRKLAALSSAHEAELLRREVVVTGRAKSGSEDVCRNVDTLHAAIDIAADVLAAAMSIAASRSAILTGICRAGAVSGQRPMRQAPSRCAGRTRTIISWPTARRTA